MTALTSLVWIRLDLRLADNPALADACARGSVLPVFIWAPDEEAHWRAGAASRVWLHHALGDFSQTLNARGSALVVRTGDSASTLAELARAVGAKRVVWNRRYDPRGTEIDAHVTQQLTACGLETESFAANLLVNPQDVLNKQGKPFKVFTAYYKHCKATTVPSAPLAAPARIVPPGHVPESHSVASLGLLPTNNWQRPVLRYWDISEAGAHSRLVKFNGQAARYDYARDIPADDGVARLSPYLHFGQLSPRQIVAEVDAAHGVVAEPFTRQIYWREFAHYLLFHSPSMPDAVMNPQFEHFPWEDKAGTLETDSLVRAWELGKTGYPLVDAGMRELWHTGWMHNRVRMNVASFLVKHLLTHWRVGARWFWDTLFDADLANNAMGWQWASGSGVDAAPFFRIFNPTLQARRFDKDGQYIRRWVPELAALSDQYIHAPWEAPRAVLASAGVSLAENYPRPIVDHTEARAAAQAAFAEMKLNSTSPDFFR